MLHEKQIPNVHPNDATYDEARIYFTMLHGLKSEIVTAPGGYTFFDAVKLHKLLDMKVDLTSNEALCAREDTERHHEHLCRMTSTHTGVVAYDWVKNYVEHTLMRTQPHTLPNSNKHPSKDFAMNIFQFQDPRTATAQQGEICLVELVNNVPKFYSSKIFGAFQNAIKLRRGFETDVRNHFQSFDEVRQAVTDVYKVGEQMVATGSNVEPLWRLWVMAFMDEVMKDVHKSGLSVQIERGAPPEKTTPETKIETSRCDVLLDVLSLAKGLKDGKPVLVDSIQASHVLNLIDVAVAALSHWQTTPCAEHERITGMKNQLIASRNHTYKYIREKELEENLEVFDKLLESANTKTALRALLGALCDLEPWEPGKLHDDRLALIAKYESKLNRLEI